MLSESDLRQRARSLVESVLSDNDISPEIFSALLDSNYTLQELGVTRDHLAPLLIADDRLDFDLLKRNRRLYLGALLGLSDGSSVLEATRSIVTKDAPFDVQCDALRLLLACSPDDLPHRKERVLHLLRDICHSWWEGDVMYSRDVPESFSRMSFALAFVELARQARQKKQVAPADTSQLLSHYAPVVLVQMAARILVESPKQDSSSSSTAPACSAAELTARAYDVLVLLALEAIPFMDVLKDDMQLEIEKRQKALTAVLEDDDQSQTLSGTSLAYILAASKKRPSQRPILSEDDEMTNLQKTKKLTKFAEYYANFDYMNGESFVSIKASILEASFYTSLLRTMRTDIFPPTLAKEKDKYLEYIPPMFTIHSTFFEGCFASRWLFDFTLWSMFSFLVDEYMEAVVVQFSPAELEDFKAGLDKIHPDPDPRFSIIRIPQLPFLDAGQGEILASPPTPAPRVQTALSVYYAWATWVLTWDPLAHATATDMNEFRSEIKKYLLFHVHQIEDNIRFAVQQGRSPTQRYSSAKIVRFQTPRTSYTTWVHTVGSGHISCPVSLAMVTCYMGSWVRKGKDGWSSVMQRMLALETNMHVAAYCRMYNDYGSVTRDAAECNLNSVNFPEFWKDLKDDETETGQVEIWRRTKETLLEVAQHERAMADILADEFYRSLAQEGTAEGKKIAAAMRIFFRANELWSDLYLTRDITNSVK